MKSVTFTIPVWALWVKGIYSVIVLVLATGSLWVLCSPQHYKFKTECGSIRYDDSPELDNVSHIELHNAEIHFNTSSARWLAGLSVTIIVALLVVLVVCLFKSWFGTDKN